MSSIHLLCDACQKYLTSHHCIENRQTCGARGAGDTNTVQPFDSDPTDPQIQKLCWTCRLDRPKVWWVQIVGRLLVFES
jgi:hypothetical protein